MHPASLGIEQLLRDCEVKAVRASGPGGQHRNKVSTGIVITHTPTGIVAEGTERRSQIANRDSAIVRLRIRLAISIRAVANCESDQKLQDFGNHYGGVRLRVAENNFDYPTILALTLDRIHADRGDVVSVSRLLQTSTSQIVRFLREEPEGLKTVNQWRAEFGLRKLL